MEKVFLSFIKRTILIKTKMADKLVVTCSEQNELNKDSPMVTSEMLSAWTEALTCDDEVTAREILETTGDSLRRYLLTGDFLCECYEMENLYQDWRLRIPGFRITRPLTLAVAFGAFKVIKLFFEYEEYIDLCQTDWLDNNIFHCLVYLCYLDCDREEEFVEIYIKLCDILKPAQIKQLLYSENSTHRRPLELAAHVGAFRIFAAFFETKDVYLVKTEVFRTFYKVHWYDVTEYENYFPSNRFKFSPLWYLVFIDREHLGAATGAKVFKTDPFLDWMQKKCNVFVPLMWAWFLLRLIFILLFTLYDFPEPVTNLETLSESQVNSTLPSPCNGKWIALPESLRLTLMSFLMIFCICVVISDIAECIFYFVRSDHLSKLPKRRKKYVVLVKVYRLNQLVLMICMFITLILRTLPTHSPALFTVKHMLYAVVWITSMWSILYFLQLIPFMGYFVITIQSMIVDILRFFILFILILVPFAFSFHRIARDDHQCSEKFMNLPISMYTTFTVMLNMVDFSTDPGHDFVASALIHLVFVFLVAILLVNFLIALFSQTVSDVTEHRDVIIAIQELSISWALEHRLSWLLTKCVFFRKRIENIFCVRDGRVYVTRVEVRGGKPLTLGIMPKGT